MISTKPLTEFMTRFGRQLFDRASEFLDPEYVPGQEAAMESAFSKVQFLRQPFPAQATAIQALAKHLFGHDARMAFLSSDMGTGKTLMAIATSLVTRRPLRTIVVCPPHLVHKWAREILETAPGAKVTCINHAGANALLARAAAKNPGKPTCPEYWVIGRVRMRMSFRRKVATISKPLILGGRKDQIPRDLHHCPSCGLPVMIPIKGDDSSNGYPLAEESGSEDINDKFFSTVFSHLTPPKNCTHVLDKDGVRVGCGSPLWSAARNGSSAITQEQQLLKSVQMLPGIGLQKASQLAGLANIGEIISSLENGEIHPDFATLLGKKGKLAIQRHLQAEGFSIVDGDYAPVEFIKRKLPKRWFDLAILDELHELKGDDSAQGVAFGILASCVDKVLGLTGTLVDGYAQSLHPLFFRANPKRMLELGYDADAAHRFQTEMGVIKEISTTTTEVDKKTSRIRRKTTKQTRNLPGLHPSIVTHVLLPNAVFVQLPDIERSLQDLAAKQGKTVNLLPSCRETFVRVPMSAEQASQVLPFTETVIKNMKEELKQKNHRVVASCISAIMYFPDGCYEPIHVQPDSVSYCMGSSPGLPPETVLPKEEFLRDLSLREKAAGRKVLVYTTYTDRLDITGRYQKILKDAGLRVSVLKSSVSTDKREQWVKDQVQKGLDVLICNPELVKTGLDLFDFVTIVFMQTGYRTDTVQQAARRSWRIGQREPVRIYYTGYEASAQMSALRLIAKKIIVANQAMGSIADVGLSSAIEDDDDDQGSVMALANAILDSVRDKSRDAITGSISCLAEDRHDGEFRASGFDAIAQLLQKDKPRTGSFDTGADGLFDFDEILSSVTADKAPKTEQPVVPHIDIDTVDNILDDLMGDLFATEAPVEQTSAPSPVREKKTANQVSLF